MSSDREIRFFQHRSRPWDVVVQRGGHPHALELDDRLAITSDAARAVWRLLSVLAEQESEFRENERLREMRERGGRPPDLRSCVRSYLVAPTLPDYLNILCRGYGELTEGLADAGQLPPNDG